MTKEESNKIDVFLKRYIDGEPIQYIIGLANFYGMEFIVNNNVLVPRYETELLVKKSIEYMNKYFKNPTIIDLGCGSGIIGITIKKEIPTSTVTCIDISEEALDITRKNKNKHNVEIKILKNNMLDNIDDKYDLIISNPPYIDEKDEVEEIVYNNEPHLALFAKNNGLYFYEQILKQATNNLNNKSIIAFEIGMNQGEEIKNIALNYFPNSTIIIEKDLAQRDRYVFILNNI